MFYVLTQAKWCCRMVIVAFDRFDWFQILAFVHLTMISLNTSELVN